VIRKLLSTKTLPSIILWGPPGTGKTTIAGLIADELQVPFFKLNAIDAGVKDIRSIIQKAQPYKTAILFLDEIHRFSKSQQDSLLHAVEKGTITLIGATTENPSFEIISPLLSRCQVYVLKPLDISDLEKLLQRAIDFYLSKNISLDIQEKEALFTYSGGDARKLYNVVELLVDSSDDNTVVITNESVEEIVKQKFLLYDKQGEYHYDLISAFIKSIRNSDPNAAIYWMARMLEGGEDPLFIARRMIILASEDIGLANPNALLLANACFDAVHKIGMPEARIVLAECAVYLASSPKSNASYMAIERATELIHQTGNLSVPLHLRNAPTQLMRSLNYHKGYKYPHDFPNHFIEQECLPTEISGTTFYFPADNSKENELKNYLKKLWKDKYNF